MSKRDKGRWLRNTRRRLDISKIHLVAWRPTQLMMTMRSHSCRGHLSSKHLRLSHRVNQLYRRYPRLHPKMLFLRLLKKSRRNVRPNMNSSNRSIHSKKLLIESRLTKIRNSTLVLLQLLSLMHHQFPRKSKLSPRHKL